MKSKICPKCKSELTYNYDDPEEKIVDVGENINWSAWCDNCDIRVYEEYEQVLVSQEID